LRGIVVREKGLSKKRAMKELREIRSHFDRRGFNNAINWIDSLRKDIKQNNPFDKEMYFEDIFNATKRDINQYGEYPSKTFEILVKVFLTTATSNRAKFRSILEEAYPLLQDWRLTQENLLNIEKIVSPNIQNLETVARFYFSCFLYLISIEGSYDNWIKIIYFILYNFVEKIGVNYDEVEKMSLQNVKKWLTNRGIDDIIFLGYEDGHLRNAIAHAHLTYIESTEEMLFTDRYRGQITYEKSLNLLDFYQCFQKIHNVIDICTIIILLLRISDILFVHAK